jgi:hypothetical protein
VKYKLFRSFGDLDDQVRKHQLVAVEYGNDIYAVADDLIRDVVDELEGSEEYKGCRAVAHAPEPIHSTRRVRRYQYEMMGIVMPPNAPENTLIDFGIMEEDE